MKYKEIIDKMTLEEKASLTSGQNFWNTKQISRLGIPSMMLTDGPHGLRKQGGKADNLGLNKSIPATCFPTAATLANSWDTDLLESVGACIGREAAANDVSVLLGPGLNIKRSPLCGRNFEYFSEDPFLAGKLAAAMIRGIQSEGVSACPKHYAVNSQEDNRMIINEIVDERALRELYLEGFRYAVTEGRAKTIMTSYDRVNGVYANEHRHLLGDVLYGEWGYDGIVVSDWGGNNDRADGLIAGCHLEMPGTTGMTDREIVEAVRSGKVDESLLDERVDSLLKLLYDIKPALGKGKNYTDEQHDEAARYAARRSYVLLKNNKGLLPLKKGNSIAIIGDFAKTPRYQGSGSSLVNPVMLTSALDELFNTELDIIGFEPGFKRLGGRSDKLKHRAVSLAGKADIAVLFLGLGEDGEAEGFDRKHMRLPDNQTELLRAVRETCPNIVVVLSCGAAVEAPWSDMADAILHTYLGGQATGGAAADLLTGRYNPSGKLAETYPHKYEDSPVAPWYHKNEATAEHRESIFIGYRYYDTAGVDVTWPFGHGLSYTSFEYGDVYADRNEVAFSVRNTGDVAGEEIAQVYVSKSGSAVFRAEKELKGFTKVALEPGEVKTVRVGFDDHAFKYFDTFRNEWVTEPGGYRILVGASSRDTRLEKVIVLDRDGAEVSDVADGIDTAGAPDQAAATPCSAKMLPNYFTANVHKVSNDEFEILLGHTLPPAGWDKNAPLTYTDMIGQGWYKKSFGRFICRFMSLLHKLYKLFGKSIEATHMLFVMSLRFNQIARMSNGAIDMAMLDGILVMVNGRFFKGLRQTMKARKIKKRTGQEK